jgi:hypothetical protein
MVHRVVAGRFGILRIMPYTLYETLAGFVNLEFQGRALEVSVRSYSIYAKLVVWKHP